MNKTDLAKRLMVSPIDGNKRTAQQEAQLNEMAASVFSTGGGAQFLDYLRSITINTICGPEASNERLRHLEGMRGLYGIIQARKQTGQKG